jgi:high-affinity nickel-transport protein
MFVLCWVGALAFWKFGHVEEKWSARLQPGTVTTAAAELTN